MRRTKGFTLIELLVVIGIIALLVSILVPTLGRVRELARQAVCASNLNGIGKSIAVYATGSGSFPLMTQYGDPTGVTYTGASSMTDYSKFGASATAIPAMQNMWLLIAGNYLGPDMFRCQSDTTSMKWAASGGGVNNFGWSDPRQFSYGISWPYDGTDNTAANANGSKLSDDNINSGLVMMTDRTPYLPSDSAGTFKPPVNHSSDGFTALVKGLSVSFYKSTIDSNAGFGGDNVYTGGGTSPGSGQVGTINGMPKAANVPTGSSAWDTSIVASGR